VAKAPTEIKSLARVHTESALNTLAGIMHQPEAPPAARVSAAQALLDRGWGKAAQIVAGDEDLPAVKMIITGVPRASDPLLIAPPEENDDN
jgi:hypothetical protein